MNALITIDALPPGALTTAEIDATMAYAGAEKALATRAAYASDWRRDFAAWCASRGATALPAHQGIVAAYLSGLADSGRKASTIGRRAAAIGCHHKMAGHEPPTGSEAVKAVLRGIRRTIGSAKQGKSPATADLIGQMVALCPDSMIGRRDRALRGGADMAGSGGDQQRPGVPGGDAGQTGIVRGPGGRQRGADREAIWPPGRARSCFLCRPQPAQRVPHIGRGERGENLEAQRSEQAQEPGHVARLRAARRSVQGARGRPSCNCWGTQPAIW